MAERQYWVAGAALVRGDTQLAGETAASGLAVLGAVDNDELRWRLQALVASTGGRSTGLPGPSAETAEAQKRLDDLRRGWGSFAAAYEARQDIAFVKAQAGLR